MDTQQPEVYIVTGGNCCLKQIHFYFAVMLPHSPLPSDCNMQSLHLQGLKILPNRYRDLCRHPECVVDRFLPLPLVDMKDAFHTCTDAFHGFLLHASHFL